MNIRITNNAITIKLPSFGLTDCYDVPTEEFHFSLTLQFLSIITEDKRNDGCLSLYIGMQIQYCL